MRYNGYKNWQQWNVSLWINNNEGLYKLARHYARVSTSRADAAEGMLGQLNSEGIYETPDGAKYSKTSIRAAMAGIL